MCVLLLAVNAYNFWATVCKTVRISYRTVVCLSCPVLSVCLSMTLVYCGQTVGWIKMKLGIQVGLGPGHIAIDEDSTPLVERSTAVSSPPTFEIYG